MSMTVKLWGVRGSLPAPLIPVELETRIEQALTQFFKQGLSKPEDISGFMKQLPVAQLGGFGGNTTCIEVKSQQTSVIIDAGSGIRGLGEALMGGPAARGQAEIHIIFTHFHWDHLMGLPFFIPVFIPGNQIHFYAVQPELEEAIRLVFRKPYFPVAFENLGAKIHFHRLQPRQSKSIQDLEWTPYQLDHPDPCWGFRFESEGKVFSHCVDTEANRLSRAELGHDLPLYQNVDLMLFDAQYTLLEATEKINWGHSAAPIGLDIALREGVKKILFMHHDPAASDLKIADAEKQTHEYFQAFIENAHASGKKVPGIDWGFAREGMLIKV